MQRTSHAAHLWVRSLAGYFRYGPFPCQYRPGAVDTFSFPVLLFVVHQSTAGRSSHRGALSDRMRPGNVCKFQGYGIGIGIRRKRLHP